MSGCCGQGPVIISGAAATPRVDVETLLLCDVLPDGTVAGLALVEPVYDTISGDRVGTRIVNPTTGAAYTPTGTLGLCSPPDTCARQISTVHRCDDTDGDGEADTRYTEVWALDPCNGEDPELIGVFAEDDYGTPYGPVAPVDCPDATADTPVVLGQICYDAAGETRTAAVLKCAACGDPAVTYLDVETGATLTAPTVVPCAAQESRAQLLCDVLPDGTSTPFLRTYTIAPDGAVTTADTALDGATPYVVTGTAGACLPLSDCASPMTPTATIGLCLPDGTPIAVTVVRDCEGTVTSEGWINLRSGAFSAGAPPVGTVACGTSQSVQVSGTFCDVDGTGTVVGLVLIEYSYATDGTIDSVRLVDAVTGATYVPTGTVTTCPTGTEQPEQDIATLCDVQPDGTPVVFIRDYRRDETGAIVGHSDYTPAGAAYAPTGTVGVCPTSIEQPDPDMLLLCDVHADGSSTPFVRDFHRDETGAVIAHTDYTPAGAAYAPTGTVGACTEPCTTVTTQLLCDSDPIDLGPLLTFTETDPTPLFQPNPPDANVKRVNLTPGQPFFDGASVTFAPPPGGEGTSTGTHRYIAAAIGADAVACPPCGPAGDVTITVTGQACNQGPSMGVLTCGRYRIVDSSTTPATALATQTLTNVGASGVFPSCRALSITATVPYDKLLSGDLAVSLDLETHDENGGEKSWIANQFAVTATLAPEAGCGQQFLRTIRAACATGAVLSVTDTDLAGAPYTVSGDVAACTPHTDTCSGSAGGCSSAVQSAQLCDMVAAPAEPIPVAASSFALTGNVQVIGDTLQFSRSNTPVTGVALRSVTGLISGAASALRFDAGWGGGGNPPATNNAIYLVEILDGATVLATSTVNLSNGSGSAGAVVAQPPLAFTAPASGTVIVRFTDQSTGGALNRDLVIRPLVVDTEGSSFTTVPFLRTYTYDCTGALLSATDTGLDGSTAYTVMGEVGTCSGTATESCAKTVVERCGCDDTTGDGTGDVLYSELWAIDPCGGDAPVLVGTYREGDPNQPYTPVSPVVCTVDEDEDTDPTPLSTGVRAVTGVAVQNLVTAFPGLQSVSLTVLAGTVNVTMTNGAAVPIPAGVTMTWSVAKDEDSALAAALFTGAAAGSQYLLNYTYR
ncbi:hypothetical protein [Streptomyces sp. NPDC088847]|uniref:hypothetical protein n=1 Tax=Streptomyces sp. NPDC088847 TaxID=3365909 RepID=UPI00381B339A